MKENRKIKQNNKKYCKYTYSPYIYEKKDKRNKKIMHPFARLQFLPFSNIHNTISEVKLIEIE